MDSNHNQEEKLSIIKKFLQKMTDSGYDRKTREEVIKSALRKHHRQLMTADREGRSIYQSREEIEKSKSLVKLLNRPWFRQRRGGRKIREEKEGKMNVKSERPGERKETEIEKEIEIDNGEKKERIYVRG